MGGRGVEEGGGRGGHEFENETGHRIDSRVILNELGHDPNT